MSDNGAFARGPWLVFAGFLVVAVFAIQGMRVAGRDADAEATPSPTASPTSTPTDTGSPATSPTPTATPTPTTGSTSGSTKPSPTPPTVDPADLPALTPAEPRRLTVAGVLDVGFDELTAVATAPLTALTSDEVTRLDERGMPGNPISDTVVVVGEDRAGATTAFGGLGDLRVRDEVVLRTDTGLLTYTVTVKRTLPAAGILDAPLLAHRVPGRLVLVGARYDAAGGRAERDLVVSASLTAVAPF